MTRKAKDMFPGDKATCEWLDSLKKSTHMTYQTYWRHFLEFTGLTGDQIIADAKEDKEHKWEKRVMSFKEWLLTDKEFAEYTATAACMAARGFFAFHYHKLEYRKGEAKRLTERRRKTEDYRFSLEDLKKMCDIADLEEKYVITAGKSFGLRAGDFLRLTRGDLEAYIDREIPISIGEYSTKKVGVSAFPFIDKDAQPIIKVMLDKMARDGRIDPQERMLTFKAEIQLSRVIRRVAERAGINFGNKTVRFHCMRKFLIDRLSSFMSESKWKQIVGKSISEGAYVSPDSLRTDYARAMGETCFTRQITEDMASVAKKEALIAIAKTMGFTDEQISHTFRMRKAKFVDEEIEELEKMVKKKSEHEELDCEDGEHCERQKVVSEGELEEYLSDGWRVVTALPSGKIVIKS